MAVAVLASAAAAPDLARQEGGASPHLCSSMTRRRRSCWGGDLREEREAAEERGSENTEHGRGLDSERTGRGWWENIYDGSSPPARVTTRR